MAGHRVGFHISWVTSPKTSGRGHIMLPILQVGKLRVRKVKSLNQAIERQQ